MSQKKKKGKEVNKVKPVRRFTKKAVSEALKVSAPPSLDRVTEIKALFHEAAPAVKAVQEVIDRDATPEQRASIECGKAAIAIFKEGDARRTIGAMIAIRRMYAVAYRELEDCVTAFREKVGEDNAPAVLTDFLVQLAMSQSAASFDEHTLMQGIAETLLPWLADVVDRHTAEDAKEQREEMEKVREARRNSDIPLPFRYNLFREEMSVPRAKTMVLVGWRPAVLYLLDRIAAHASKSFMTVFLTQRPPKPEDSHALLAHLGGKSWSGAANSDLTLGRFMGDFVADKLSQPTDLLLIEDLGHAYTKGFVGRDAGAAAGDAQRKLRKWCDRAEAALVGGILYDDEDFDPRSPALEQIRTFTDMVPIHATMENGEYRIVLGDLERPADIVTAPAEAFDYHGSLLMPSGVTARSA